MIVPGCREQQCLKIGAQRLADACENEMAHDLSSGRAARLACHQHLLTRSLKTLGQHPDLRRLSRAFATLERNEVAALCQDCGGHRPPYNFAAALNRPMKSSPAVSKARPANVPRATARSA